MNIWSVLRVVVFGIILGVFVVGVPLVWFFNFEPNMLLGIMSGLAGILAVMMYNLYKESQL